MSTTAGLPTMPGFGASATTGFSLTSPLLGAANPASTPLTLNGRPKGAATSSTSGSGRRST